jgi:hypothetical protein
MLPAISPAPPAASVTDRDISVVVAVCSSTALAMVVCRSEICATIVLISPIAATAAVVSPWMAWTRRGDVLGGLGRLLGQLLDLVGDHGEALARLTGPGGLDGGVQRQQVGLLGDAR